MTAPLLRLLAALPLCLAWVPGPHAFGQQPPLRTQTDGGLFAEIRGKITSSRQRDSHTDHLKKTVPMRYSLRSGRETDNVPIPNSPVRLSQRTVVYLEGETLSRGRYPPPAERPVLDQKDLQFQPQVLAIRTGTTVDFPNRDNLFHNVFSYSPAGEFDLGRYPKDDSRSVTFDRAGVVRVYCDIHSHMNATILVLPHPYFATPDDGGTYSLSQIPEGKYMLVLWYDRDVVERRPIELKAGDILEANFTF